jgi:hypothetical protein
MSLNYTLLAEIGEVGLLAIPFRLSPVTPALYDRVWLDRDSFGRGGNLNRYTGDVEYLTQPPGFGVGGFGDGIFGWS